ncbi:hypothetical protein BIW11_11507 [Tropilaelaps mercedesae]|uniref:Uncharacterized protein n=1 Tax=Tropilaelaps mercedesae TaxID=418985 RepID=A0A1V9XAR5_9ACAR|nr:hypothetical protein BIW11_11507 [Tropilaelaps mercedesae]
MRNLNNRQTAGFGDVFVASSSLLRARRASFLSLFYAGEHHFDLHPERLVRYAVLVRNTTTVLPDHLSSSPHQGEFSRPLSKNQLVFVPKV